MATPIAPTLLGTAGKPDGKGIPGIGKTVPTR